MKRHPSLERKVKPKPRSSKTKWIVLDLKSMNSTAKDNRSRLMLIRSSSHRREEPRS